MKLTRRTAIKTLGAATLTAKAISQPSKSLSAESAKVGIPIGFSTYGLPGTSIDDAVAMALRVGYDTLELCVTEDRDECAEKLSFKQRRDTRRRIYQSGLEISSLMAHLQPLDSAERHQLDLERLKRISNLAHDLSPELPPVIQTVLGGTDWKTQQGLLVERLASWAKIAKDHEVTVAIKPHRGHAMSRPTEAKWLIEQLGSPPSLKMWFDYSHFVLRDMTMDQTVQDSLPILAGVAVKDAKLVEGKVRFALPGEAGTIDYKELFSTLYEGGYREAVCVEVSSQVWKRPDYRAFEAMDKSYVAISNALIRAQIPRRH
ncbi:MAG: sugar phosphate isomerase/epimerase family protein [Rubripirellula sp.]